MSQNISIAAFDCGTVCGWAVYHDGRIDSGIKNFSLKRGEVGRGIIYLRFANWVKEIVPANTSVIAYEKPFIVGGKKSGDPTINVNMIGQLEILAHNHDPQISTIPIMPSSIKLWATGNGRASKDMMVKWFEQKFKRAPQDDNEADSTAVLFYVLEDLGVKTED
jgi:Holliday junction resolvasome RuvABC endonuclease subunit